MGFYGFSLINSVPSDRGSGQAMRNMGRGQGQADGAGSRTEIRLGRAPGSSCLRQECFLSPRRNLLGLSNFQIEGDVKR